MGQNISGQVVFSVNFQELVSSGVLVPYDIPEQISGNVAYTNGVGSGQVNTIYAAIISFTGSPVAINLQSLVDPDGISINFARIREFIPINGATTPGFNLQAYAASSNGWSVIPPVANPLTIPYSAGIRIYDPISTGTGNGNVVTPTSCNIVLNPGANTFTGYLLAVGGSSA